MDTSTLSFSDPKPAALPRTSALHRPQAQPIDWFTHLLARTSGREGVDPQTTSVPSRLQGYEQVQAGVGESVRKGAVFEVTQVDTMQEPWPGSRIPEGPPPQRPGSGGGAIRGGSNGMSTILLVFIPVMVVVLTVLVGLVCFLIAVLFMRRRRGIRLTEDGGPLDLSKSDGVMGEGGVEGVEARWLETCEPDAREGYKRAKDWQEQYPPSSVPTDITLSQFLSIQEKGVSAWSFEPDYEDNLSLYVQSRTEITFLADGPGMPAGEGGGNNVMANLPLPKLNEVYYWEVKLYEKPANTEIAVGLATKPYPSFRLPGWNRQSVAYFASDGFKSHNFPFTASSYGPQLNEGDVLGVGYRPRTGTVFFTRNGRKMDDAYSGLQRLNLFPTIGANGPCTIHVNLGQAGFVFIEANVKKWGLAPMVGTLAPPPAYGSERGSILLDAGYGTPGANSGATNQGGVGALLEAARSRSRSQFGTSMESSDSHGRNIPHAPEGSPRSTNSSRRHRRPGRSANLAGSQPAVPSPLRGGEGGPGPSTAGTRRRILGRVSGSPTYVSPTDTPLVGPRIPSPDALEQLVSDQDSEGDSTYDSAASETPSSPLEHNPPTPNLLDISLHSLSNNGRHYFRSDDDETERNGPRSYVTTSRSSRGGDGTSRPANGSNGDGSGSGSGESEETVRAPMDSPPPPGYAPLDPHRYAGGLPADLPEELVNQAIAAMTAAEGEAAPVEQQPAPETPTPAGRTRWFWGSING